MREPKMFRPWSLKMAAALLFAAASLRVQASSLLLDFGPTAVASAADMTNDPAHALGSLARTETSWNTGLIADSASLVYSDGTSATGVSIDLGRSDAGVTGTVNFNNNTFSTIAGSSSVNTGVFAGNSAMKDGVFASGTYPNSTTNMLGLKISGLPAGSYTLYVAARNCNVGSSGGTNGQDPSIIYYTQGANASTFNFASPQAPSKNQSNLNQPYSGTNGVFVAGVNYASFNLTLAAGNCIYVAVLGTGADDRGFLNLVEVTPATLPIISSQPSALELYAGRNATFTVGSIGGEDYSWCKNDAPISGANSNSLTISNIAAADAANYTVVITNFLGAVTSSVAQLTVVATNSGYEAAVLAAAPLAYYRFNETSDSLSGATAYDFVGGFNGVYGAAAVNGYYGVNGPAPEGGFPGFSSPNYAVMGTAYQDGSDIALSPWNLTTNAITITAWINPTLVEPASAGLLVCRGANVAGFCYSSTGSGNLSYIWNNDASTYGWDSGISAPPNLWSLAALVVTPTNATIYVFNSQGVVVSTHAYAHPTQTFGGTTLIGNDPFATSTRGFGGEIDEVAVFPGALSQSNIFALYSAASGVTTFAPSVATQPASVSLYQYQTAQFTVVAGGSTPLSYQWWAGNNGAFAKLSDDGRISGSTNAMLTVSNLSLADLTNYLVIVTNSYGSVTSSVATLTIMPTLPAINYTMSIVEPISTDWNTTNSWVPDGEAASLSAVERPGSTYELLSSCVMRTPDVPFTSFPGAVLTADGVGTTRAVIALKGATNYFGKIVLAGGALTSSYINGSGNSVVTGNELNIQPGAKLSGGNGTSSGKTLRIESQLTGSGDLQCQTWTNATFLPAVVGGITIAGGNNTYSGTWDIVSGTLVGSGPKALGTNTITVEAAGALQTTYDINNPLGDLILSGRMNLTQNDTFRNVVINGTKLAPRTYGIQELTNSYAAYFPATWVGQTGVETLTNASGSLTVLGEGVSAPGTITVSTAGGKLQLTWTNANVLLLSATNILGPWVTNANAATPYPITNDAPQKFFRLQGR